MISKGNFDEVPATGPGHGPGQVEQHHSALLSIALADRNRLKNLRTSGWLHHELELELEAVHHENMW